MRPYCFFVQTQRAIDEISEIFQFLWPTALSVWNLQVAIKEHMDRNPNATADEINSKFMKGADAPQEVDLFEFVHAQDWQSYKRRFARTLLLDIFSVYEHWAEEIIKLLAPSKKEPSVKAMQYPTKFSSSGAPKEGVGRALDVLHDGGSNFMNSQITSALRARNPKYNQGALDAQMQMYRYFKEVRNCLMHRGGIADDQVIAWQSSIAHLSLADLGLSTRKRRGIPVGEVPKWIPTVIGKPVTLDLRGVVGLSDLVTRAMITIDTELSSAKAAENEFCRKWKAGVPWLNFPSDNDRREKACLRVSRILRLPPFANPNDIVRFARMHRLAG